MDLEQTLSNCKNLRTLARRLWKCTDHWSWYVVDHHSMAFKNLTCTLVDLLQPVAADSRQLLSGHQLASTASGLPQITERLQSRWSLDSWLKSWQDSSWLAVPKKKVSSFHSLRNFLEALEDFSGHPILQVSPHRRGMRNAGKHQKLVPVVARCK